LISAAVSHKPSADEEKSAVWFAWRRGAGWQYRLSIAFSGASAQTHFSQPIYFGFRAAQGAFVAFALAVAVQTGLQAFKSNDEFF
jgi:hypothetical protein